jgi:L-ascorbate metabolism protein UlaG (beta-lactamase superfamily)
MRTFFAVLAGLLIASAASAADGKKITVRWHGQSFFEIKSSAGTRIVIDPHAIEAYGPRQVEADLVLMSHEHNDHNQVGVVTNYKPAMGRHGLKLVGRRLEWNLIDEKFKDIGLHTVGTFHDNSQGMERGRNAVFILEIDGLRIVHLGDLGHSLSANDVKRIGPVDVLMIPVGGVYTLNGSDAKKVVEQLKPKMYVIPMHYGTKVYDDLLPIDEFLDEQKRENIRKLPTNELVIDTDFKPAEPVIAVLSDGTKK